MERESRGTLLLLFSGQKLGEANSKWRWARYTELKLFKEASGTYVLEIIGGSPIPGEEEKRRYIRARSPEDLLRTLRMRKQRQYTKLALRLINAAVKNDPALKQRWEEVRRGNRETGCEDHEGAERREVPELPGPPGA